MRRRLVPVLLLAALALRPAPADAWGFVPHRFIMEAAVARLPPALRPFFETNREFVAQHVIDPDTWRTAGFDEEAPNHFLDFDAAPYGPAPHDALPRDLDRAVETFGVGVVNTNGRLPWRAAEFSGNLRRAFETRAKSDFGDTAVLEFAAWLTHYVSDAYVPFHAVTNHDGQLTGQHGIHSRWETQLFERYASRITVSPAPLAPVPDVRALVFATLLESERLAPDVLKADLAAIGTRDAYDDAYFETFFTSMQPLLQRRLGEAIAGAASVITAAWEAAGKPSMAAAPRRVQSRRR